MITTIFFTKNGVVHDLTLIEDGTKTYRYTAKCDCGWKAVQNSLDMMSYEIDRHKVFESHERAARAGV